MVPRRDRPSNAAGIFSVAVLRIRVDCAFCRRPGIINILSRYVHLNKEFGPEIGTATTGLVSCIFNYYRCG